MSSTFTRRLLLSLLVVFFACAVSAVPGTILTGWVHIQSDYGFSINENAWLYFESTGPIWTYDFTTGGWGTDIGSGWFWVQLPNMWRQSDGHWLFAQIPPGTLWVYNFSTGTWTVQPAS